MHVLIFSGGRLGNWALSYINEADFIIGVDAGASFLARNQQQMNAALGDFDSVSKTELESIRKYANEFQSCDPVMKDLTDTEMGLRFALKRGATSITVVGGLGTRFDHSLANVHLLKTALEEDVRCKVIDSFNQIQLMNRKLTITKDGYDHVSLLPLTKVVTGITLIGFKYPLENATLQMGMSLGISNLLNEDEGTIQVKEGELLVIQSQDKAKG